jgi:hypothetical protein
VEDRKVFMAVFPQAPSWRLKVGFCVLLGMLSTCFAEVLAGSTKFPFFMPWGLIVVFPLYSLHILVLATILVRHRKVSWPALWFAGALFGLYEAYITKVLWHPDWATNLAVAGEVRWLHVVLLVLWWHPLFAFIVPLFVGETLLTRSRSVFGTFSEKWRARLRVHWRGYVILFGVACGVLATGNALPGVAAVVSPLVNGLVVLGLIWTWRRFGGPEYSLAELLPGRRGLAALAVALGLMYVVLGSMLLPQYLPGAAGHVLIWALYALFLGLLWRAPEGEPVADEELGNVPWLWLLGYVVVLSLTTLALKVALGAASPVTLIVGWAVACTVGVYVYARAAWRTLRG